MHGTARSRYGFTLVELMVTIAVAAILLTAAAPSFRGLISDNRMAANVNEFIAGLNLARSEAIKRSASVTVCKGAANGCDNSAEWNNGWIVFADMNADDTMDIVDGDCSRDEDCLLRVNPPLGSNYTFRGTGSVGDRVTYDANGMSAGSAGTLIICDHRPFTDSARGILIAVTGRAQLMKGSDTGETSC